MVYVKAERRLRWHDHPQHCLALDQRQAAHIPAIQPHALEGTETRLGGAVQELV
jgi:hypothetical protein